MLETHLLELLLEHGQHRFLDKKVGLIEVFNNELVVMVAVDVHEDRLDGRLALDQHACRVSNGLLGENIHFPYLGRP